ncbi:hypothetical protein MNBD_CHLOROFLEXI01-5339, partial [hydrothermal vent metagenome]
RSEQALISMGIKEIENIIATEGKATVDCHFCHEQYVFNREELEDLLKSL